MASLQKNQLNISAFSVAKIILVLLSFYLAYLIIDLIAIVFIAFVLFAAIDPIVTKFHKYHIPRSLSVIIIYLILFIVLSSIFILLAPNIIEQSREIIKTFPAYLEKIFSSFSNLKEYSERYGFVNNIQKAIDFLQESLGQGAKGVFSVIAGIFGGIASFFIILVMTFYMIVEKNGANNFLKGMLPEKIKDRVISILGDVKEKLGLWARAQMILSLAIFILVFTFLSIFKIEYALVLALIAGLMEFIPYLGPILAAIPAVIVAFFQSPVDALIVIVIYFLIQEFENIVLVPQVMKRAVGINPIISITGLLAGFRIGGVFGAIIAIPLIVAFGAVTNNILKRREDKAL